MELLANWQGVEVGDMMAWFNGKFKDYLSGKISGRVNVLGAIPNAVDGYKQLRAEGRLQLQQSQFNTFQISEKISSAIEKLRLQPVAEKNSQVRFQAETNYELLVGNLHLSQFLLTTEKKDELRLRGMVDHNLQLDLTGTVAIGSVTIGGAIAKANVDKSGRMVVPLQVSGDIHHPDFALSKNTLKTMLEKAALSEAKNISEKLKKELGPQLKDKLKKIFEK